MSGRGPWHNDSTVSRHGDTVLGHALIAALTRLAQAGAAMPSNKALGGMLDCDASAVGRLLMIHEREGALIIERRGRTFGLQRRVTIVAAKLSTAPIEDRIVAPKRGERITYLPHKVAKSPPVPEGQRVERTRCPLCELPPHHAECRHGWDGAMTAATRQQTEAAVAHELRRAA